jgi:alpha-galactosidase
LRGLDPAAMYLVEGYPEARSGRAWMHLGLELALGDFTSCMLQIERV